MTETEIADLIQLIPPAFDSGGKLLSPVGGMKRVLDQLAASKMIIENHRLQLTKRNDDVNRLTSDVERMSDILANEKSYKSIAHKAAARADSLNKNVAELNDTIKKLRELRPQNDLDLLRAEVRTLRAELSTEQTQHRQLKRLVASAYAAAKKQNDAEAASIIKQAGDSADAPPIQEAVEKADAEGKLSVAVSAEQPPTPPQDGSVLRAKLLLPDAKLTVHRLPPEQRQKLLAEAEGSAPGS